MFIKQKINQIKKIFTRLPLKITIPICAVIVILFTVAFFANKPVQFSYAGSTCIRQVTLLPSLSRSSGDSDFNAKTIDTLKLGSVELVSLKTCFTAKAAPRAGVSKVSVAPFGGWFGKTTFAFNVPKPPIAYTDALIKPIPTNKPLVIDLSSADTVFDYQLEINNKIALCPVNYSTVHCNIASLELTQGASYSAQLVRVFDDKKVGMVAKKSLTMLTATSVIKSSVSEGLKIYEKPKSFSVEFDKDVVKANITLNKVEGAKRTEVVSTSIFDNKQAILSFTDDLARGAAYELSIDKLEAKDGSTLADLYKTNFTVSGGPKVTAVNVGKTGAALTQTVVLTFDQPLSDTQDILQFISLKGVAATISKKDNQAFISYVNAPKCTDFTIGIVGGLQSRYEVVQNEPWSFGSRTICHSISTIGYSKDGRPITAYIFGSGGRAVLYTGSIHGNELSAKRLMLAWVDELELNAHSIPADKQIIVIPALNPDGVAVGIRNNANNVDLNRNFDTADWQKDITSPSNRPIENGGGTVPMSETETQAIATFTTRLRPRLTMSFHSVAGYAIANQGGDSLSLAATYAQMTGYRNMTGSVGAFDYSISGTYDDWIREKLGLPSVLVELASSTSAEFSRNKAALWTMARS
ncbi:DUF2817 domain-containing protein [Candidatus Saccharibacteria bacterium]|nr:DUF2817 domain-containing protein [Candidatus Saccharibacteria bacterium]